MRGRKLFPGTIICREFEAGFGFCVEWGTAEAIPFLFFGGFLLVRARFLCREGGRDWALGNDSIKF